MKNLFILGDSISCPRPWEGVGGFDTYAYILQSKLNNKIYVQNLAYSDRCTSDYLTESFIKTYITSSNASYMVIQLGIVDCAPRLLTTFERGIGFLARRSKVTGFLFNKYVRWKSKNRLFFTKWFPLTRVKPVDYENNVKKIIEVASKNNPLERIFIINVAYPGEFLTLRSYGIHSNVLKYNEILFKISQEYPGVVRIIDLYSATSSNLSWITRDDGHHITPEAHIWLASEIYAQLNQTE
ncbi:hypothetical protein GU260_14335 [Vibrio cholerae]|uniref:SGNH/GDSL hydrolase family protein n=1 Tax=Vibrio cholerae TaxID=666 RepID=UPI00155E890D|nr:SGNH/GDSL hydrolase family protein [Vibrio cholerae]NOE79307.1 hypothetical protein [Vibrio cholerae]